MAGLDGEAAGGFDWRASFKASGLDVETTPLQPQASHLCHLLLARLAGGGAGAGDCPLDPLYLSEPLLGPSGAPGSGGEGQS